MTLKGVCPSHESCPLSRREEVITVDHGDAFECPVCKSGLQEVHLKRKPRRGRTALPLAALVVLAGLVCGFFIPWRQLRVLGGSSQPQARMLLRLAGSNTIGSQVGPALAEAYLRAQGAKDVYTKEEATPDVRAVYGMLPGDKEPVEIEIAAHGSATGFRSLADGSCDLGMASRRVNASEVAQLSSQGFGVMTDAANEHILGLDGVAVIVNRRNPLNSISKKKLQSLFDGDSAQWEDGSPVHLYARDDNSGTYDTFASLVLAGKPLAKTAKRFEDSTQLSNEVANDPDGIGFIGLPYVLRAKALAVSDEGTEPLLPTLLTVATEDYVLSRRLYLYTPANPAKPQVREFVQFALSPAGQKVVAANGFMALTAEGVAAKAAVDSPIDYRRLTAKALRIPIDFRFVTGEAQLDNRALPDLDRVEAQLASMGTGGAKAQVLLFGFSDSSGGSQANQLLSLNRAKVVAEELTRRGIAPSVVEGFGSALPVASNDSPDGREKNRRVEIWIEQ